MRLHHLLKVLDLSMQQADSDDKSGEQHEQNIVDSIMKFGRFTSQEALMVKPISSLAFNPSVLAYLEGHSSLPIFKAELYFRPKKGHVLDFDLIQCFANGSDPAAHENTLRLDTELHCIALRFSRTARDTIILVFVRIASVLSSICGFMYRDIPIQAVIDVLNRFLSPLWSVNLAQNLFTGRSSDPCMVQGWSIVHECLKVLCQDLAVAVATKKQTTDDKASSDEEKDDIASASQEYAISREAVMKCLPLWYQEILSEFFIWVYTILPDSVTQADFINTIQMVATPFLVRLLEEMDCVKPKQFNMDTFTQRIARVADGEPSMAEIQYDPVTMSPTLRTAALNRTVTWKHACISNRCRGLISPTVTQSDSMLFRSPGRHPKLPVTADGEHRPSRKHNRDDEISDGLSTLSPSKKRVRLTAIAQNDSEITNVLKTSSSHIQKVHTSIGEPIQQLTTTPPTTTQPTSEGNEVAPSVAALPNDPIESFFTELTSWNPGPQSNNDDSETGHLAYQNDIWLKQWSERFKDDIKRDVTTCKNMEEYGNHWKPLVMMEMRGSIATTIRKNCPSAREKTSNLLGDFQNELQNLRVDIVKVSPTRGLIHLKCHSNDTQFTRTVAKDLQGGIICLGYIEKKDDKTKVEQPELSIFACRNVSWNDQDYAFGNSNRRGDDILDVVEMSLTISRKRFCSTNILEGDRAIIAKLTTYSPHLRIFKSLHDTTSIPPTIRKILCDMEPGVEEKADESVNITPLSEESKTFQNLEGLIDPGCAGYLGAIRRMGKLNESQHIAVLSALASMGDCKSGSSSLSMIKGPPGTGKTDCIIFLVGALMHHTQYGHIGIRGHRPVNALRKFFGGDRILRRSSNDQSFSFLITASSNNAVDNVMLRIKDRGILGRDGYVIRPEMCRIARQNYDFAELSELSINSRALPFDRYLHHRGKNRKTASTRAIRSYKQECILYFATLTTVAGPQWKDCKIPIDVVITDEGAHPFEPEVILPFIATRRHSPNRRMLAVLAGDNSQLVEPPLGLQLIRDHKLCLPFNYEFQMTSLFERLFSRNRVTCCMLMTQYRMHPSIANIHFRYFYDGMIRNGRRAIDFKDDYNQGPGVNNGYAPFTCIDTSRCEDRFERKKEGGVYYNDAEISVINSILWKLYYLVKEDLGRLDGAIAILIPYRSQVDHVRAVLMEHNKFVRFATRRASAFGKTFDIVIDTCDGMQGRERDIVIFAATRSNEEQEVGFLSDKRRLNVAMSRMKKLMIFIGDFSTLTSGQARYFSYIDRVSNNREFGAHRVTWH